MAEEDILFGKNRHLFGGIEPSNMIRFRSPIKRGKVCIEATPPNDTIVDGQTLCTVAGVVIRRKTDGYPLDEFDGDLVCDMTRADMLGSKIYDEDADISVINYYAAFPYSTQGVYNRNPLNRCSTTEGEAYMYGFDIDTLNPDPSTRVSYPDDVDNTYFNPAYMDYDTSIFNYGDWNMTPGTEFMPRPCVINNEGQVLYYLNPNDYTKKEDGTDADIYSFDLQNGSKIISSISVMMEWPKIYTHREITRDGIYKFRCSNIKYGDDWECWCNYNHNDFQVPHFYTAVYSGHVGKGYTDDISVSVCNDPSKTDRVYSACYNGISDSSSNRVTYFLSAITNRGAGWNAETLVDRLLIQDLLVMMGKNTNCQEVYGLGARYSSTNIILTGTMNNKGLFWGANDNDNGTGSKYGVKVFGMEHWWGNVPRYVEGHRCDSSSGKQYINITHADPTNNIEVGTVATGYISTMEVFPFGRIPVTFKGSTSTYECDKVAKNSLSGTLYCLAGGEINDNLGAGPFASSFIISTTSTFGYSTVTMPLSYR